MQAPANITTTLAAIDGQVVKIGWTDPNTTTYVAQVWNVDANGNPITTGELGCTKSTSGKWAYLTPGTYALSLKDSSGNISQRIVFTTAPATVPPPPPAPMTAQQMLATALGTEVDAGDVVQVYPPTPSTSKTVQADGSIA